MTWEKVPPPRKYGVLPAGSVEGILDALTNMTEEEARIVLQNILDTMTYEEQAEYLRDLDDPRLGDEE